MGQRRGAPLKARDASVLAAITAAVVGVILNLAIWFALHFWFGQVEQRALGPLRFDLPQLSTLDPMAFALSLAALVVIFRFRASPFLLLGLSAAAGLLTMLL